jgi:hypothetical protein
LKKKRKKGVEYGNMTEMVAEEIKRIKRALSKEKDEHKIDFKKLFPVLKYGKIKVDQRENEIDRMNVTQKFDNIRQFKGL